MDVWEIIGRAMEVVDYMDRKYVRILEDIVLEEAEILEKEALDDIDRLKLIGLSAMKRIVLEELGVYRGETSVEGGVEVTRNIVEETVNA
jgi:hypothetical protein